MNSHKCALQEHQGLQIQLQTANAQLNALEGALQAAANTEREQAEALQVVKMSLTREDTSRKCLQLRGLGAGDTAVAV